MAIARHKTRQRELRDERALTRRVQRGDRRAFELLYASYEGRLFRFCHRVTGSAVSAAALVEATFARALADLPEDGLETLDVAGYLYATARTLAYERSANGGPPEADDGGGPRAREVGAANRRLAPRQRMALALRDLEGRPDDEIAVALAADETAVAALVARARMRLRAELELPAPFAACAARMPELSAYSDGTLPLEERAGLESHIAECPHCRAELFALREAELRYRSLPVPVPPGELGTRMAVALDAVGLAALRAPAASAGEATGGRQTAAAAAMAALVIVGAGITIAAWRDNGGDGEPSRAPAPAPAGEMHANASRATLAALTSGGRQTPPSVPPALRHLRAGPAGFPHIPGPPPNASAIATAPAASGTSPPPAPPAPPAAPPEPPPAVPVVILPPAPPAQAPAPAAASPPPAEPPPPAQTTTT